MGRINRLAAVIKRTRKGNWVGMRSRSVINWRAVLGAGAYLPRADDESGLRLAESISQEDLGGRLGRSGTAPSAARTLARYKARRARSLQVLVAALRTHDRIRCTHITRRPAAEQLQRRAAPVRAVSVLFEWSGRLVRDASGGLPLRAKQAGCQVSNAKLLASFPGTPARLCSLVSYL